MIRGIPGILDYFVDRDGNIYSQKARGAAVQYGKKTNRMRIFNPEITKGGYRRVGLTIGGRVCRYSVHHLVLATFKGPRPKGMLACHGKNGVSDNSVKNLYYATSSQNQLDRIRDGTDGRGEKQSGAKLNRVQVRIIRRLRDILTQSQTAKIFGVHQATIWRIQTKNAWEWL